MTDHADTVRDELAVEYARLLETQPASWAGWPALNLAISRLDALVAERDRLRTEKKNLVENNAMLHRSAVGNRDLRKAAEADRDQLVAAVRAWDATLSEYCDGPERDAVRASLTGTP